MERRDSSSGGLRSLGGVGLVAGALVVCSACQGEAGEAESPFNGTSPSAAPGAGSAPLGADPVNGVVPVTGVPGDMAGAAPNTGVPGAGGPSPEGTVPNEGNVPGATTVPGVTPAGPVATNAPAEPPPFEPVPASLRRLTRTQFRNVIRDVFDVSVDTASLDSDDWTGDFAVIGAHSVVTSERGVEQYHTAIENAVNQVFADDARRTALLGCTPAQSVGDECTRGVIERLGRRAFRRPLASAEVERMQTLADGVTAELGDPLEGARWVTIALFTSPNFLYRSELGAPAADGSLRYSGFEMASRLAFLIWNSAPDDQLLDDAQNGLLDSADGVATVAARLLDSDKGREAVGSFAEEYMRLDRIGTQAKDVSLFPEYGAALQAAMARDVRDTWVSLAFDEQLSALDLFSTSKVMVNAELAALYGLDGTGLDSSTFEARSLPEDSPRVGILGKAGFLSQFANQKEGSPTLRGKFMRQSLMCTKIPPPPGDVDVVLDDPPADMPMTKRQRLEQHRTESTCSSCHSLMDPLGLPFENFDAIGRYRTTENGLDIDPSGEFNGVAVADSRALGFTLAESDAVARCLVRKYYSYALGIQERDVDKSVIDELDLAFSATDHRLRDLVLEVATHEAFATVGAEVETDGTP